MIEDTAMNDGLEPTLERFDQAMLALHLSRQSKTPTERVEQTTKAHNGFTAVLVDLEALSATDPIMGLTDV